MYLTNAKKCSLCRCAHHQCQVTNILITVKKRSHQSTKWWRSRIEAWLLFGWARSFPPNHHSFSGPPFRSEPLFPSGLPFVYGLPFTSGLPDGVCKPWRGIVVALNELTYVIPNLILVPGSLDSFCLVMSPDLLHAPVPLSDCRSLARLGHPTPDSVSIIDRSGLFLRGAVCRPTF